ncbi:hypothetical protein ABZ281_04465 [Streptomyces sp. NPDC006265]|uniref:hypothetical protein n=1 Tax=Streptomyces sp. NPDC006265 TaxID=3156740 RepID=UPI0033A96B82
MAFWSTKRPQHNTIDLADASARMDKAAVKLRLTAIRARHATADARRFTDRVEAQIVNNQGAA